MPESEKPHPVLEMPEEPDQAALAKVGTVMSILATAATRRAYNRDWNRLVVALMAYFTLCWWFLSLRAVYRITIGTDPTDEESDSDA